MLRAQNEDGHAHEVQHDGGHVHHVVGPVAPAGEEPVKVAEDFFGPEIDAAFAGKAVGELDDGNALGPEEKQKVDEPEPDRDATVCGDGGDNVEIEDSADEEENEVEAAEDAAQTRGRRGDWRGAGCDLVGQIFSWRCAQAESTNLQL